MNTTLKQKPHKSSKVLLYCLFGMFALIFSAWAAYKSIDTLTASQLDTSRSPSGQFLYFAEQHGVMSSFEIFSVGKGGRGMKFQLAGDSEKLYTRLHHYETYTTDELTSLIHGSQSRVSFYRYAGPFRPDEVGTIGHTVWGLTVGPRGERTFLERDLFDYGPIADPLGRVLQSALLFSGFGAGIWLTWRAIKMAREGMYFD